MFKLLMVLFPFCNAAASTAFIDPLRACNYLIGETLFHWEFTSPVGGEISASNGLRVATKPISELAAQHWDLVMLSSSWAPEDNQTSQLHAQLKVWAKKGCALGAIDTGTVLLAEAGLLNGRRATAHYEHIDALRELYPQITIVEDLYVFEDKRMTCCGGAAAADMALELVRTLQGETVANEAARYVFHQSLRPGNTQQNPERRQPLGYSIPIPVVEAIKLMEAHLEHVISIPDLSEQVGVSQRHLDRLFQQYVRKTPALYYRDIRLDRARGLVTQTEMALSSVAMASGFPNQSHFCRLYRERFGITPRKDRLEGRVPFDYRAWPMHQLKQ